MQPLPLSSPPLSLSRFRGTREDRALGPGVDEEALVAAERRAAGAGHARGRPDRAHIPEGHDVVVGSSKAVWTRRQCNLDIDRWNIDLNGLPFEFEIRGSQNVQEI